MTGFIADVTAFVERAKRRSDAAFRAVGESAVARVKELTPVRTGNLRANWTLSKGQDAQPVERSLHATISTIKVGDVLIVSNPVSYAAAVEYGRQIHTKDGRSVHVPGRGMLTQTVKELPQIADKAVRRVIKEDVG